jgi:ubiquinone/menaquinone biosynthesis C-methylase UbiE
MNNQKWFNNEYLLKNSISGLSESYFNELISENSKGNIVLDMACGFGRESIIAAKSKAELVVGIDLSPVSVKEGNELALKNNLNNIIFSVADCENLYFDDDTFDTIICARMLHHIEFETVMKELQRVLKKDGRVICIEALGINPLLNFYRKVTPEQRTHWETANILTFKHIKVAQKYFKVQNIKYWHFLSPLAKFSRVLLPIFNFLDSNFFSNIPFLNRLAWTFTFELKKENS